MERNNQIMTTNKDDVQTLKNFKVKHSQISLGVFEKIVTPIKGMRERCCPRSAES